MHAILAPSSVGITELKANPNKVIDEAEGHPVAVLNRNKPVAYVLTAELWEAVCEKLENLELLQLAQQRLQDGKKPIRVSLDDL